MTTTSPITQAAHAAATFDALELGCLLGLAIAAILAVSDRSPATAYLGKTLAVCAAIGLCLVFVIRHHLAGPLLA